MNCKELVVARKVANINRDSKFVVPLNERDLSPFIHDYSIGFTDSELEAKYNISRKTVVRRRVDLGLGAPNRVKYWIKVDDDVYVGNTPKQARNLCPIRNLEYHRVCTWQSRSSSSYKGKIIIE